MSLITQLASGERHTIEAFIMVRAPGERIASTEIFVTKDQDVCLAEGLIYPDTPDVIRSFELPEGMDSVEDLDVGDTLPGLGLITGVELNPSSEMGSTREIAPPPKGKWLT